MSAEVIEILRNGRLANLGLLSEEDIHFAATTIKKIVDDGSETVRLVFPDQHGIFRGKTLSIQHLVSAAANGIGFPSSLLLKDTSHRTVFPIWQKQKDAPDYILEGALDVIACPDFRTCVDFNWASNSSLLICDLYKRNGAKVDFSSRQILKNAITSLQMAGYKALFGLEVEFQIFRIIDDALKHDQSQMPPAAIKTENITQGWQYLTETRYGEVEEILDELRQASETMNLGLVSTEIEMGPSQFEFTFGVDEALTQADKFLLFRTMVKEICRRRQLHATFMAKPIMPNSAANGWHIHQSIIDLNSGLNAFMSSTNLTETSVTSNWIAGLLHCARDCCLLTTPTVNGYKRYQPNQLAPTNVNWGYDNRGVMLRALIFDGDPNCRVENRVAESAANPYFAFASQIMSGLFGLKNALDLQPATLNPYELEAALLPRTLGEAISTFNKSAINRKFFGDDFVDYLTIIKKAEWDRYNSRVSQWEQDEYFNNF